MNTGITRVDRESIWLIYKAYIQKSRSNLLESLGTISEIIPDSMSIYACKAGFGQQLLVGTTVMTCANFQNLKSVLSQVEWMFRDSRLLPRGSRGYNNVKECQYIRHCKNKRLSGGKL